MFKLNFLNIALISLTFHPVYSFYIVFYKMYGFDKCLFTIWNHLGQFNARNARPLI